MAGSSEINNSNSCEIYNVLEDHWGTLPDCRYSAKNPGLIIMPGNILYKIGGGGDNFFKIESL